MDVTDIFYIKCNSIYSLPEASYRRFISCFTCYRAGHKSVCEAGSLNQ